jgi:hypothetical protein
MFDDLRPISLLPECAATCPRLAEYHHVARLAVAFLSGLLLGETPPRDMVVRLQEQLIRLSGADVLPRMSCERRAQCALDESA